KPEVGLSLADLSFVIWTAASGVPPVRRRSRKGPAFGIGYPHITALVPGNIDPVVQAIKMNITEIFVSRPVMTTLVMLGIVLFGVMGYQALPVSDLPNVDFPTIQVNASLPGASPETIAASVATPLEREFTTISGLDSMTSTSVRGSTSVTLQFSLERALDSAAQDVQAAIAAGNRR